MQFEWDEAKRAENLAKHGVDFVDAAQVLSRSPLVLADERRDYGEPRYIAWGELNGLLLSVVFTVRGEALRIISARRANARERRRYGQE